jgi:hypothetical protein
MSKKKFHLEKETVVWIIIAVVLTAWMMAGMFMGKRASSRYP